MMIDHILANPPKNKKLFNYNLGLYFINVIHAPFAQRLDDVYSNEQDLL